MSEILAQPAIGKGVFQFEAERLNGEVTPLSVFEGKVLLIVNTASRCGYTEQYEGLEALYEEFKDQGFTVLGFPCNQFAYQEPGGVNDIRQCLHQYSVQFPVFKKIKVNGKKAHPLYVYLKNEMPGLLGGGIKWNFTKFLIDRNGQPIKRYSPGDTPEKIRPAIERLLSNETL